MLTLALEIDSKRGSLGQWEKDPYASGIAARRLAVSMIRTHADAGFNVIVPQYLARAEFVQELEDVARSSSTMFHEVVLVSSADEASRRFAGRASSPEQNHRDAYMLQSRKKALPIQAMYEAMIDMARLRRGTIYVESLPGRIEETLACLRASLPPGTHQGHE